MRQRCELVAALVLGLTLTTCLRADEAESVKVIEKAGGQITFDDKNPDKPVVKVVMWGPRFHVDLLKELKAFKSLEKLRIGGPWITDEGVKGLKEVPSLQVLEVRSPRVTDAALKDLQEAMPKLKIRRASPGDDK